MDVLGGKLRELGFQANAHSYIHAGSLAAQAVQHYKAGAARSIVVIGHSFGGAAAIGMANQIGQAGVPVALVIPIEATGGTVPVSANVRRVVNFYVSDSMGGAILAGPKFQGEIKNLDFKGRPEGNHADLQASDNVHQQVIGYILAAI
jgi:hypothetical protein